jgi:dipeptidyl aminopeptidase/acylaminoacyl peptidase
MTVRPIYFFLFIAMLLTAPNLVAQQDLSKKPLAHQDYDVWNKIERSSLSGDGKWAFFTVRSGAIDGESTLYLRSLDSKKQYVIERAASPSFSWDSRFALYQVTPPKKKLKELEKSDTKTTGRPKTEFQILDLASGDLTRLEGVESFRLPEKNGDWVACFRTKTSSAKELVAKKSGVSETYAVTEEGLKRPEEPLKLKKRSGLPSSGAMPNKPGLKKSKTIVTAQSGEEKKLGTRVAESTKKGEKKNKKRGEPLTLVNLKTGVQRTFPDVTSFAFSKHGEALAFATSVDLGDGSPEGSLDKSKSDKNSDAANLAMATNKNTDGVSVIPLGSAAKAIPLTPIRVAAGTGNYKNLVFSDDGKQLAFICDKDDFSAELPTWALYHWKSRAKIATKVIAEGGEGIPAGWWVSPNSSQFFSENGKRLFFETAPIPASVQKKRAGKSKEDEPKVAKLDIWHWQDPQLQPQQLLLAKRERQRDYRAVYLPSSRKVIQLATEEIPNVAIDARRDSNFVLATTDIPYRKMLSWDVPGFKDAYLVNLDSGVSRAVLSRVKWNARMSPGGKYLFWFDGDQQAWFAKSTDDVEGQAVEISQGITFPLYNELHDTPSIASAYGSAGWLANDSAILIYDRYDIWRLDPSGEQPPICLTQGQGREKETAFRYRRLNREERSIDPKSRIVLRSFDYRTKASGYWQLNISNVAGDGTAKPAIPLKKLIVLDESLDGLQKADQADRMLFSRSTFRMCPDLWFTDREFKTIHRLSDINPQQENYVWGSAEIVNWKSAKDKPLQGILYKPDGFDPLKQYPLMVYFYERNSDNLHRYYTPEAGRSIINFSFYVSRGYLVFIPDIPYSTGEPGQSAADAILPGVEDLVKQGFVDSERIGMQGHSWGGYQTAYLVTQTDMFACAESGAPVSNMTSAYGGIRWGSGMSRMFQYERTQSRIGEDLWAAREKYIRNSPIFYADKINTPLLILHNDEDGAVPWYQGIELFVALRRLEKPAWMLNYNGDPHWVMGDVNRRDFAIRMQQFFDHYLKDAPEPEWMAVGVPAVKKGQEMGLELLEPESISTELESETAATMD